MSVEKDSQAVCERIVRLLREERQRRGLTKYAAAQRSGLSQQAIGSLERGEKMPSLTTILRYAAAVEADLPDVIRRAQAQEIRKRHR